MGKLLRTVQSTAIVLYVSAGLILVACSLPFTGWRALSVQTGSMEPNVPTGSLVLVHRVSPDSLAKGDVITYTSRSGGSTTITHRMIDRKGEPNGPKQTIAKGDANKQPDAPIYDNQIVGKVVTSVPYLGKALDILKTPWGLAAFVYLPALVIAISEIRLLVKRLTKLELEKQKKELRQEAATIIQPMSLATAQSSPLAGVSELAQETSEPASNAAPVTAEPPKETKKPKPTKKRMIGRMGVILLPLLAFGLVAPTLAQLEVEATLTDNVISSTEVTPPNPEGAVLINRVDFPWAKTKWFKDKKYRHYNHRDHDKHDQPDPVAIYLYSEKNWKKKDINGWTISNTNGVLYTLKNSDRKDRKHGNLLIIKLKKSQKLAVAGDFLVLKDSAGTVVDALSWGSDTTYLNPSVQDIKAGDDIKRKKHQDTDTAADWRILP